MREHGESCCFKAGQSDDALFPRGIDRVTAGVGSVTVSRLAYFLGRGWGGGGGMVGGTGEGKEGGWGRN